MLICQKFHPLKFFYQFLLWKTKLTLECNKFLSYLLKCDIFAQNSKKKKKLKDDGEINFIRMKCFKFIFLCESERHWEWKYSFFRPNIAISFMWPRAEFNIYFAFQLHNGKYCSLLLDWENLIFLQACSAEMYFHVL
jgi:hypothetical protein